MPPASPSTDPGTTDGAIALVAAHSGALDRLPGILSRPGVALTYVGCAGDPLLASATVDVPVPIGPRGDIAHFARSLVARPDVVASLPDWTLWGDDMDLIRVARSDLAETDKLRILPVRRTRGLPMLGSKTGFATLVTELGLPAPRSVVVMTPDGLADALGACTPPFFVKGERGGAAGRLRLVEDREQLLPGEIPDRWFPVLIQEQVPGTEVAVEALFGHGRLLGWLHSTATAREDRFGRHLVRRFADPSTHDFVETLQRLGEAAGLHGLANCTFIRTGTPARHLLVEADMRANGWHQFGPLLGVDWGALMLSGDDDRPPVHPEFGPGAGRAVHLYPRDPLHALTTASWSSAWPWIVRAPGTWDTRIRGDRAIRAIDRRALGSALAGAARSFGRRLRW